MSNSRPSGLGMISLVGGCALVVLMTVLVFVPVADCLECEGSGQQLILVLDEKMGAIGTETPRCDECHGRGKVGLLRKWTLHRNVPAR
jgi:hypothetical protein